MRVSKIKLICIFTFIIEKNIYLEVFQMLLELSSNSKPNHISVKIKIYSYLCEYTSGENLISDLIPKRC